MIVGIVKVMLRVIGIGIELEIVIVKEIQIVIVTVIVLVITIVIVLVLIIRGATSVFRGAGFRVSALRFKLSAWHSRVSFFGFRGFAGFGGLNPEASTPECLNLQSMTIPRYGLGFMVFGFRFRA